MDDRERRIRRKLRDDFPHYAAKCLKIRTKSGGVLPLRLNQAQRYIHEALEEQKALTGMVRALILKGRQQGSSTYTEARLYHQTTHRRGCRAFILTHEDEATKNIFEMAERFQQYCPALVKPELGAANAKELYFSGLDSGYRVGTARTKGVGRSGTVQLFHGSEVAYWHNAEEHASGVLQSVPREPGTEIILESTSAGPSGVFHDMWQEASRGESDYIPIFVPWFWQEEYRASVAGFEATAEERAYADLHGLDDEQLAWRRGKIVELHGVHRFRLEYPATAEEAFTAETPGAIWTRELIDQYRVRDVPVFRRMAVAIDPSTTSKATSDDAGIIWGGVGTDGHCYLVGDETQKSRPIVWAGAAVRVYQQHRMEAIVYETNQGGDMVDDLIKVIDPRAATNGVHASRGKRARAEPVAALFEQGLVHIVGRLPALEDELCSWDAATSNESPNRLDAMVWLVTFLMIGSSYRDVKITNLSISSTNWMRDV